MAGVRYLFEFRITIPGKGNFLDHTTQISSAQAKRLMEYRYPTAKSIQLISTVLLKG
jgi:hypothetical protein